MYRLRFVWLALMFVCVPAYALEYQAVDLGMFPGSTWAQASSVNNLGQVVGYGRVGYQSKAFTWDSSTGMRDLGLVTGTPWSMAASINNHSDIAVWTNGNPGGGDTTVVINDDAVVSSWPNQGTANRMFSINDAGQMVGWGSDQYPSYAVMWDGDTVTELLPGTVPQVLGSMAWDINNNGWAVGYYNDARHLDYSQACIWRSPTHMEYLLSDMEFHSEAVSINDSGQVVGWADTVDGRGGGFLWENGQFRYLTLSEGMTYTRPSSINNPGQIVGAFGTLIEGDIDPIYSHDAFVWEEDVFSKLPSSYRYSEATSINDNGWIVGWASDTMGYNETDVRHAMLWVPVPEPQGYTVLLAGLVSSIIGIRHTYRRARA